MNLKNYTSGVPASATLSHIEAYLASAGVTGISKQYEAGQPSALFFHIDIPPNRYTIRLPARIKEVQDYLWQDYCSRTTRPRKTKEDFLEQATRCAWAIQRDWVQVQISLVKSRSRPTSVKCSWDSCGTASKAISSSCKAESSRHCLTNRRRWRHETPVQPRPRPIHTGAADRQDRSADGPE